MKVNTVNISFRPDLLKKIDQVAKKESRTRSELIREAARMYIEKKDRWKNIFAFGDRQTKKLGLTEKDVAVAINDFRKKPKLKKAQ